jgi:hypothetical protein
MEHKSLEQLRDRAAVVEFEERVAPSPRALRRMRLERLAHVLAKHDGPVTLLTRIEFLPEHDRLPLRIDNSPLEIAYRDPVLRGQGLAGDRLGDGMTFFDLSQAEVHYLLCDCHYSGMVTGDMIAARVRSVANRLSVGEMFAKLGGALRQWFGHG